MATAKDQRSLRRSTRTDPRVDPDSRRGARRTEDNLERSGLRDVVTPRAKLHDPRADPDSIPGASVAAAATDHPAAAPVRDAVAADVPAHAEAPADVAAPPRDETPKERAAGAVDPRLAEIEPLVDRTAWKEIADRLGPLDEAAHLPPALALIQALAQRESGGDQVARRATELAIRSMAALLGVAADSPAALVLAKRMLRQNPASWHQRPAPSARLSVAFVILAVAIGVAAGSLLNLETFRSFKLF